MCFKFILYQCFEEKKDEKEPEKRDLLRRETIEVVRKRLKKLDNEAAKYV